MNRFRLFVIAITVIFVLSLGVFGLVRPQNPGDDVIIIKGGSLIIKCGNSNNTNCLPYDSSAKEYKHKKGNGKIEEIVVKDSYGKVLGTFTRAEHFSDGKPTIEVTYK
jgi:hypothetical protein